MESRKEDEKAMPVPRVVQKGICTGKNTKFQFESLKFKEIATSFDISSSKIKGASKTKISQRNTIIANARKTKDLTAIPLSQKK